MKLQIILSSLAISTAVAFAEPTITVDRVQQRYPWNGIVDIDYTIAGIDAAADPNDFTVVFGITDAETGLSTVASNFLVYAACDLPSGNGSHRIAWEADADGFETLTRKAKVTASLLRSPVAAEGANYMIVDVSGGIAAETYPVRFVCDPGLASSVFNRDLYKTTRIVLKKVEAGSFWMGEGSTGRDEHFGNVTERDGVSRHYVKLSHDFMLGVFPVTLAQYMNVVEFSKTSSQDVPTTPVTCLWWYETQDLSELPFFSALLAKARCRGAAVTGFTLPTESQWEYACRAGMQTTYYNGQNYDPSERYPTTGLTFRNMLRDNFATGYCIWKAAFEWPDEIPKEGLKSAMGLWATGQFPANPWGFYDMIGNGFEWCSDWYAAYPSGTEAVPAEDPRGPQDQPSGAGRCFRSTSTDDHDWSHIGSGVRSPESNKTSSNYWRHGFRLAFTLPNAE